MVIIPPAEVTCGKSTIGTRTRLLATHPSSGEEERQIPAVPDVGSDPAELVSRSSWRPCASPRWSLVVRPRSPRSLFQNTVEVDRIGGSGPSEMIIIACDQAAVAGDIGVDVKIVMLGTGRPSKRCSVSTSLWRRPGRRSGIGSGKRANLLAVEAWEAPGHLDSAGNTVTTLANIPEASCHHGTGRSRPARTSPRIGLESRRRWSPAGHSDEYVDFLRTGNAWWRS